MNLCTLAMVLSRSTPTIGRFSYACKDLISYASNGLSLICWSVTYRNTHKYDNIRSSNTSYWDQILTNK
nr:hypothetical protein Q903MT_gene816 [Picea sitchensis]